MLLNHSNQTFFSPVSFSINNLLYWWDAKGKSEVSKLLELWLFKCCEDLSFFCRTFMSLRSGSSPCVTSAALTDIWYLQKARKLSSKLIHCSNPTFQRVNTTHREFREGCQGTPSGSGCAPSPLGQFPPIISAVLIHHRGPGRWPGSPWTNWVTEHRERWAAVPNPPSVTCYGRHTSAALWLLVINWAAAGPMEQSIHSVCWGLPLEGCLGLVSRLDLDTNPLYCRGRLRSPRGEK